MSPRRSRPCRARCRRSSASQTDFARQIKKALVHYGIDKEPIGIDVMELPMLRALEDEGIEVVDGQQALLDAREIKTPDEIELLKLAAAMVDATYVDIARAIRPGTRENELVAIANDRLFRMGSERVECVNSVSGPRGRPHSHTFSDRMIQPGDMIFLDIMHSYNGYRTCYYRTFICGEPNKHQIDAYETASKWISASIDMIRPGVTPDEVARVWPDAKDFGYRDEAEAFLLQYGHGVGLSLVGAADLLQALHRPEHAASRRHGVRARDLEGRRGRLRRGAHRGRGRRHQGRVRDHHQLPVRPPDFLRPAGMRGFLRRLYDGRAAERLSGMRAVHWRRSRSPSSRASSAAGRRRCSIAPCAIRRWRAPPWSSTSSARSASTTRWRRTSDDTIVVLENGCLCCTVFGDLVGTLNTLYHRREAGEIPPFDHVVIETSGLADPAPVVQAFLSEPTLAGLYPRQPVIVTVDAVNGPGDARPPRRIGPPGGARRSPPDHQARSGRRRRNARRRKRRSSRACAASIRPPRISRDRRSGARCGGAARRRRASTRGQRRGGRGTGSTLAAYEHHDHDHDHETTATVASTTITHDDDIASFAFIRDEPTSRYALQLLLNALEQNLGPNLLRVKGLVNVAEEPERPAVIQGAQHLLHNISWLERWPDADRRTRIVFITQNIDRASVEEMIGLLDRVATRTARRANARAQSDRRFTWGRY